MKYLLAILMLSSIANAKEYELTYNFQDGNRVKIVKYKTNTDTLKEAKDLGAQFCFNFFADQRPFDEDYLLSVIDTCANPSFKRQ